MSYQTDVKMAATSVESWIMRPIAVAINNATRTVSLPPEKPNEKEPFGITHYTCLPSKSIEAGYECKKGFDSSLNDERYIANLVTKLAIQDSDSRLRIIYADDAINHVKPDRLKTPYWACYDTLSGLECQEGHFQSATEEGRVKYISVPTLMPSHEWYIKQRWPRARVVEKYTDWQLPMPDLNKTDSKS